MWAWCMAREAERSSRHGNSSSGTIHFQFSWRPTGMATEAALALALCDVDQVAVLLNKHCARSP